MNNLHSLQAVETKKTITRPRTYKVFISGCDYSSGTGNVLPVSEAEHYPKDEIEQEWIERLHDHAYERVEVEEVYLGDDGNWYGEYEFHSEHYPETGNLYEEFSTYKAANNTDCMNLLLMDLLPKELELQIVKNLCLRSETRGNEDIYHDNEQYEQEVAQAWGRITERPKAYICIRTTMEHPINIQDPENDGIRRNLHIHTDLWDAILDWKSLHDDWMRTCSGMEDDAIKDWGYCILPVYNVDGVWMDYTNTDLPDEL